MSDRSSVRDSEERGNSVPGRASKRARGETDIEKVCRLRFTTDPRINTSYHTLTLLAFFLSSFLPKSPLPIFSSQSPPSPTCTIAMARVKRTPRHAVPYTLLLPYSTLRATARRRPFANLVTSHPHETDVAGPDLEQEETFQSRPSIRIVMPDNLKALIVDDWERVTKNGTIVKLPAPKPVRKILQDWRDEEAPKRTESRIDVDVLDECIAGVLEYFDVMLDKLLLYRYERPQYRMFRKKYAGVPSKDSPNDVYGAEHLIRLFSM